MDEMILRSLAGETTPAEEREVARWRAASQDNERHYQQLVRLARAAKRLESALRSGGAPDPQRFLTEYDGRIISQRNRVRHRGRRRAWAVGVGSAAAIVVLAFGWLLRDKLSTDGLREIELVTGPGETTTATLGDAGVVRLGPATRLLVSRTAGSREVWLDGRAFFSIAKRPGRPFKVRTEAGDAIVLGTRFDLEARQGDLRVVVVEGRVRVASASSQAEVGPSEMGVVVNGTTVRVEAVEDVHAILRGMEDFITFDATPLREVARELERRFGIDVEIHGEELADRQVNGWSAGRSLEDVLEAICRTISARCRLVDGVAIIEP